MQLVEPLAASLGAETVDMRRHHVSWEEVRRRTSDSELPGDPSSPASAPGRSPISSTSFHRSPTRTWCSSTGRAARSSPMTCSGTPTSRSASASTRCGAAQPETSASRRARPARSNACSSSTGRSSSDTSRRSRRPSIVTSRSATPGGPCRSQATRFARRCTVSPDDPSARGPRSFPAHGAVSGSVDASASRPTPPTSPGRTS